MRIFVAGGSGVLGRRLVPLIGGGTGSVSWVHLDDAASATVIAIEQRATGVFNIVGAERPVRTPAWLAQLLAGEMVVGIMTERRGFSNTKARRQLGWEPRYPSWRQGFRVALT